jgi:DNA replication and repair protein RecF
MLVQRLTIREFRNIRETSFFPDPRLNVLVGANGQGKTSILEALGYLATLRSFRDSKTLEVIRYDQAASEVSCALGEGDWQTDLKVSFVRMDTQTGPRGRKLAYINGKPYTSSTQYLSQRFGSFELGFHAVVFNPSDHRLVAGEPANRRSFLDRVIAAEDVEYLKTLQKYQRVLEQRNAILKAGDSRSQALLLGFTEPLAEHAAALCHKRLSYIQRLAQPLIETARYVAPKQPDLRLIYLSNWAPEIESLSFPNKDLSEVHFAGHGVLPSLEILEQAFWTKLSSLEAAEWRAGHSLVGPHRDDWAFFLGNQTLKGHGSQGEVRSALLALKLSEIELFQNQTGHRPIFLLDDFSSELDEERRSFLLRFLTQTDLQVFVSTTEGSFSGGKRFRVEDGQISELSAAGQRPLPERPNDDRTNQPQ